MNKFRKHEDFIGAIQGLIDNANLLFDDVEKLSLQEHLEEQKIETRICSKCGKLMIEGYCIEDGDDYFCSHQCLETVMTIAEFDELYNDGEGNSYYTDWN